MDRARKQLDNIRITTENMTEMIERSKNDLPSNLSQKIERLRLEQESLKVAIEAELGKEKIQNGTDAEISVNNSSIDHNGKDFSTVEMIAIQSNDAKENEKYSKSMKNWNENNPGISAPMDFGRLNLHDETIFNVSKHPNTVALNAEIMDDGEEKQRNNLKRSKYDLASNLNQEIEQPMLKPKTEVEAEIPNLEKRKDLMLKNDARTTYGNKNDTIMIKKHEIEDLNFELHSKDIKNQNLLNRQNECYAMDIELTPKLTTSLSNDNSELQNENGQSAIEICLEDTDKQLPAVELDASSYVIETVTDSSVDYEEPRSSIHIMTPEPEYLEENVQTSTHRLDLNTKMNIAIESTINKALYVKELFALCPTNFLLFVGIVVSIISTVLYFFFDVLVLT